jgi:hypothetical protein
MELIEHGNLSERQMVQGNKKSPGLTSNFPLRFVLDENFWRTQTHVFLENFWFR